MRYGNTLFMDLERGVGGGGRWEYGFSVFEVHELHWKVFSILAQQYFSLSATKSLLSLRYHDLFSCNSSEASEASSDLLLTLPPLSKVELKCPTPDTWVLFVVDALGRLL